MECLVSLAGTQAVYALIRTLRPAIYGKVSFCWFLFVIISVPWFCFCLFLLLFFWVPWRGVSGFLGGGTKVVYALLRTLRPSI